MSYSSLGIKQIDEIIRAVIGASYEVSNGLGTGFLEKIYERALILELSNLGLSVQAQQDLPVIYKGNNIGVFQPDIVVNDCLIVELKCCSNIAPEHQAQCLNYLRCSGIEFGLIINFGKPKVEWKRMILSTTSN